MEPNDLPNVVLPTELSGESAVALIDFLQCLIEGLQRLSFAQIPEHERQRHSQPLPQSPRGEPDDTPF